MDSHLTRDELQRFLAQDLGEEEDTALEKHVQECSKCQTALQELIETDEQLKEWRSRLRDADSPSPLAPDLFQRIVDNVHPAGASPHPAPVASPVTVPGYEILDKLGQGGMGVVYKARQVALKRLVALKMIRAGSLADAEDLVRFRQEAEAVARLQHPNIVQVYEVSEWRPEGGDAALPFFSLEFVGGGNLDRKLDGRPLPAIKAAGLVAVLARAVQAAHQAGVVHRDLKPGNVLLARKAEAGTGNVGEPPSCRWTPLNRRLPTSASPSYWTRNWGRRSPGPSWARRATWPPSRPGARTRRSARPPTYTRWGRSCTSA
jgi:hypothetical protein